MKASTQITHHAHQGFTLIEVAISIAILCILSLAVSNMMMSAMNAQMSYRNSVIQENIAMNLVDRLRIDLRQASAVRIVDASRLEIDQPGSGTVTYLYTGNTMTRNGQDFTAGAKPAMDIRCDAPCFQGSEFNALGNPKQVVINNIQVLDVSPGGSALDNIFGKSRFWFDSVTFDVLTSTTFQ